MPRQSGRPFAAFDIDGTLIRWQLYHAIADELAKNGLVEPTILKKIKSARMTWKQRAGPEAFKAYEHQLVVGYEKLLLDLTVSDFNKAATGVFEQYKDQVYTYTRELIKQLKKQNYLIFAVSGSQIEVVKMVADYYGFDASVGTIYAHERNRFTGAATVHLGSKHLVLEELVKQHGASWRGSMAVGDSASDISMLEAVEQPIAFNPEKKLFDYAKNQKWPVVVERKNVIYELGEKDGKYQLAKTN